MLQVRQRQVVPELRLELRQARLVLRLSVVAKSVCVLFVCVGEEGEGGVVDENQWNEQRPSF